MTKNLILDLILAQKFDNIKKKKKKKKKSDPALRKLIDRRMDGQTD